MARQAGAVLTQVAAQLLHLLQHQPRVVQQGVACRRGLHAALRAQQQGHAQRVFHAAYALAGRGQRHVAALGTTGDGAGLVHVHEQPQVGQVKAHGPQRTTTAFGPA